MPGGAGRKESAREGNLRVQIFDAQGKTQEGQTCQWATTNSVTPIVARFNQLLSCTRAPKPRLLQSLLRHPL